MQEFRFFTNEFETRTQGVDLVLTAPVAKGDVSLAYNYTDTEVTKRNTDILDDTRVRLLEDGLPKHRGNITLTQNVFDNLGILGRVNYYGPWYEYAVGAQTYSGTFLMDIEINYAFAENLGITVGVNNVFNVEPNNITWSDPNIENFTGAIVGRPFGEYSPYGFWRRVLVYQSRLQFLGII